MTCRLVLVASIFICSSGWTSDAENVVGSSNPDLSRGAELLAAGNNEEGIRLTLLGLESANNAREEEIGLSNLCAGYTNFAKYETALKYCNVVLARNDKLWRVHNSKALIYIHTMQYEKAEIELNKGEAINPDAKSFKIARAMYMDATKPVETVIVIDDRQRSENQ